MARRMSIGQPLLFLTLLWYALRMDKLIVNVELRGEDIALLDKLKAALALKGYPVSNAAVVRYALRVAGKRAA